MLIIAQIYYIRKLFFDKGKSITEIPKATGHNNCTIKKYIKLENFYESESMESMNTKSVLIRPFVREITWERAKKEYRRLGL